MSSEYGNRQAYYLRALFFSALNRKDFGHVEPMTVAGRPMLVAYSSGGAFLSSVEDELGTRHLVYLTTGHRPSSL